MICFLNSRGIRVALLTRNSKKSLDKTIALFTGKVDLAFSREIQPSKPHTDPFVRMANEWGIPCESLLLAGDHLDDFIPALGRNEHACLNCSSLGHILLCETTIHFQQSKCKTYSRSS